MNRFGRNFVQTYVEFNGGGRGTNMQANSARGRPLQKNIHPPQKNIHFISEMSAQKLSLRRAYHM